MPTWLMAVLLKPFVVLAVLALCAAIRFAVLRWWPEGRLKRLLLLPIGTRRKSGAGERQVGRNA